MKSSGWRRSGPWDGRLRWACRGRFDAAWSNRVGLLVVMLLSMWLEAGQARGQNCRQWGLRRDPCNVCLLRRYYSMLDANPNDSFPMRKLRKCRSLTILIKHYESRLRHHASWYAGHVVLGHLYRSSKRRVDAVAQYRKAIALKPNLPSAHWSLGRVLQVMKKWREAVVSYEKALALTRSKTGRRKILRSLVDVSIVQKDLARAKRYFHKLLLLEPGNRYLRGEYARMLTRHLMYKDALVEYKVLLRQARGDAKRRAELLKEVGELYEKMGSDPKAIATYRKAMRLTVHGHWLRRELTDKVVAIYRRKNDIQSLVAYYEHAWHHKGFFEWRVLAELYDELGKQFKAIKAYRRALAFRPSAVDTRDKMIRLLERVGRHGEALKAMERQMHLAPGEPRYLLRLARMYWRRKDKRRAIGLLRTCGRKFSRDASVHTALADLYNKWGKPNLAFKEYQRLVRIEPNEPSHLVNLGEQYWQRGRKAQALGLWRRLLKPGLYQTKREALSMLGQVLADHDQFAESLRNYRKAIKLAPKDPSLYRAVAPVYERARRYAKAVSAWLKVIELAKSIDKQPWRRQARSAIIALWIRQGTITRKLSRYRSVFDRTADLESGYFLGEAYIRLKKLPKAEHVFRTILAHHPEQVEALLALGEIYRRQHQLAKAVGVLLRLAKLVPSRAREFYMRIAELYLLMYRDDKALAYARKALTISKGDAEGWARVARIYEKKGDDVRAIEAYRRAIKIRPRFFSVSFALARIYLRRGDYDHAVSLYHDVVRRSPNQEMVARAGRRSLDLDEYLGRLPELERILIPLSFVYSHKPVYGRLLVQVYGRWIPALVRRKRFGSSKKARDFARHQLAELGKRALKPLLESLSSGRPRDRELAVSLVGHLGNKDAAPSLVRLVLEPPESSSGPGSLSSSDRSSLIAFQVRALVAAGRLQDPRTVSDLVRLARNSEPAVREAAVWSLGLIGGPQAFRALSAALSDRKVGVEALACLGLGRYGAKAVPKLVSVVTDRTRRVEIRAACAWALGWTNDDRAVSPLLSIVVRGRSLLHHKAAWALGMLARSAAVPSLLDLLWTRRGQGRIAVRWGLVRSALGKPSKLGLRAIEELDVADSGRLPVAWMVRHLRPGRVTLPVAGRVRLVTGYARRIVRSLDRALHRHTEVLIATLLELDSCGERFCLGPLDPGQRSPSSVEVVGAGLASRLVSLTRHPIPDVRALALSVLGKVSRTSIAPLVAKGLGDPVGKVRTAALRAAVSAARRRPGDRGALLSTLEKRLASDRFQDPCSVIGAMSKIGGRTAWSLLRRWVERRGRASRCGLEALVRLDRIRMRAVLETILARGTAQDRLDVVDVVARMGGALARTILRRALQDKSSLVQQAARSALAGKRERHP